MPEKQFRLEVESRDGAVYLLRTAQQHHVQLSAMADQKANILIGAALVIFTLSLSQFHGESPRLSLLVLIATAVIAGLFAVLAVMPRTSVGKGNSGIANPLFFGHFAERSEEEFLADIKRVLSSDQSIYFAMARDFYQIGQVLYRKKYRYLGYSYRAFVIGLVLTLASLCLELFAPGLVRLPALA